MHVHRFLELSAVYLGLAPEPGVAQTRTPERPGLAADDDTESAACCCEVA